MRCPSSSCVQVVELTVFLKQKNREEISHTLPGLDNSQNQGGKTPPCASPMGAGAFWRGALCQDPAHARFAVEARTELHCRHLHWSQQKHRALATPLAQTSMQGQDRGHENWTTVQIKAQRTWFSLTVPLKPFLPTYVYGKDYVGKNCHKN